MNPHRQYSLSSSISAIHEIEATAFCALPLMAHSVQAGFPSPAEDFIETDLDLKEHLVKRPAATFMVRLAGPSMEGAGLFEGDILIVDRAEDIEHGDIVIACVDGELTVKRLFSQKGLVKLQAEHPDFPDIEFKDGNDLIIWGVVTSSIKKHKR